MIDALKRIAKNEYTIFTAPDNHTYDDCGLPIARLPSAPKTIVEFARTRLFPSAKNGILGGAEIVIAPIYTTRLLAMRLPFVFTLHDLQERYLRKLHLGAAPLAKGIKWCFIAYRGGHHLRIRPR